MSDKFVFHVENCPDEHHEASHAWSQIEGVGSKPNRIEVLKRRNGKPLNKKSKIFRLSVSMGSRDHAIIAKQGPWTTIETERIVYQDILPIVGIPSIRCLGSVNDRDGSLGWLFLEEIKGKSYDVDNTDHQRLAADALAQIHLTSAGIDAAKKLPAHNLDRYVSCLYEGICVINASLDNPVFNQENIVLLQSIVQSLRNVKDVWHDLADNLISMPQGLVHGDFVGKNVRVRIDGMAMKMYIMDWDISGWGAPAFDIEQINADFYQEAMLKHGAILSIESIQRMQVVGRILRNIGLIRATSTCLCYDWVEKPLQDLSLYSSILSSSLLSFVSNSDIS